MIVLLGVDESDCSKAAVEFVMKAAWPKDSRFLVVSASPPVFITPGEVTAPSAVAQVIAAQEAFHRDLAEKAVGDLRKAGLKADARMVPADPRVAIVDAARQEKADLVIVGSHGRSGFSKLILGSVASHIIAHSPCNVLVVKQPS
ncbi:MAG: universal stress protein [Candidatus Eiseniibacteriota bacterium]